MVDLISEGVDCVIRVGALQDSDIICRKLGEVNIVTCGSPAYFDRHGVPGTKRDRDTTPQPCCTDRSSISLGFAETFMQ